MDQNRGNWFLLTGLILGLIFGLVYSWVFSPVTEVDTHPHLLRDDYKDIYRSLISRAYKANNNLPRAEARLELIGDKEPALALAAQAQRFLAEGGDNDAARLTYALRLCIARPPGNAEVERFRVLFEAARDYYRAHPDDAERLTSRHAVQGVTTEENAAWVAA